MTWLAFIMISVIFIAFLGLLFWCIIKHDDWAAKTTVGAIDGLLIILLRTVFNNLFPGKQSAAETIGSVPSETGV